MLQIPQPVYDQLRRDGEAAYPHECCGVLLGIITPEAKIVTRAVSTHNASPNALNHYLIASSEIIRILREAGVANLEIAGFYHSHPDHPAYWSATDLAEAHWLGCSYIITSVARGHATDTNAFHLAGHSEEDKYFESEEIRIQASMSASS
jgi:proteasome lid subunit RPN8/RPN11